MSYEEQVAEKIKAEAEEVQTQIIDLEEQLFELREKRRELIYEYAEWKRGGL